MALPFTSTDGPPAASTAATFRVASTRLSRMRLRRSSVQRPPATGSPARFTQASQRESSSCQAPGDGRVALHHPCPGRQPGGRVAAGERHHLVAVGGERGGQGAADEPGGPGDEDAHGQGIPFGNFTSASLLRT